MACAIAGGATTIVQMDCDFSHDPAVVPELLSGIESGFDLVVGSRYVDGGRVEDWPLSRRLISRVGCTSARLALDLPLRDLTGGFKAWRTDLLRRIAIDTARSSGYSFQIETTWRAQSVGARIVEVPIVFRERVAGVSKMNGDIVREAIGLLVRLRRAGRFHEVQAAGSG
jgi:dolichol-phosphate mannosyltransferase